MVGRSWSITEDEVPVEVALAVGSYAEADQPGVQVFGLGRPPGRLRQLASFSGIGRPSFVVAHPHRPYLYAVSEMSAISDGVAGEVVAICVDVTRSSGSRLHRRDSGGDWPCHLALDPTQRCLIVTNYGSGAVGVLSLAEDGALGPLTDVVHHNGSSLRPDRQDSAHPHSAVVTPAGGEVVVADLGTDELVTYRLDAAAGTLQHRATSDTRPGSGPRHMVFDRGRLFVLHELDSTLGVFVRSSSGRWREVQTLSTLPEGADPSDTTAADLRLAPSGRRLYASNRGDDSIAVFGGVNGGELELLGVTGSGGSCPRSLAVAPDGRHVAVANQLSDEVVVLPVETDPTYPAAPAARVSVHRPSCVQFL